VVLELTIDLHSYKRIVASTFLGALRERKSSLHGEFLVYSHFVSSQFVVPFSGLEN
jgi:hypothetical protein